jgi:hypothetical protein
VATPPTRPPLFRQAALAAALPPQPRRQPAPDPADPASVTAPAELVFPAAELEFADPGLCPAQRAFLARKAAYATGGPFMPPESYCVVCGGDGKLTCIRCGGNCVLPEGVSAAELLGLDPEGVIRSTNGRVDIRPYLKPGGPCFACRGTGVCGCHLCEGTGLRGGVSERFSGD